MTDLSYVPVDVPLPHVVVPPGLHYISHSQINTDQAIVGNAQDLVFTDAFKSERNKKKAHAALIYIPSLNWYSE